MAQMNIAQRAHIERVTYGDGHSVEVYVWTQLINADTGAVISTESAKSIRADEPEGDWGNAIVEELLRKDQTLVSMATPGLPATPEIKDPSTGAVLRPAMVAVPPQEAVYRPTFEPEVEFVWNKPDTNRPTLLSVQPPAPVTASASAKVKAK